MSSASAYNFVYWRATSRSFKPTNAWNGTLLLEIQDDGDGFSPEEVSRNSRHGLQGMQERADLIGADSEPEELHKAILLVNQGMSVLSPHITRQVLRAVNPEQTGSADNDLSSWEMEVLQCLAKGLTIAQIAGVLYISENTVKTHVRHILEKLEASNRAEAVSKAMQLGLIGQQPE
jgi:DNA-binding NarL/FixJ family response regulator